MIKITKSLFNEPVDKSFIEASAKILVEEKDVNRFLGRYTNLSDKEKLNVLLEIFNYDSSLFEDKEVQRGLNFFRDDVLSLKLFHEYQKEFEN